MWCADLGLSSFLSAAEILEIIKYQYSVVARFLEIALLPAKENQC
jgi:hypothetical protein